jgi:acetyl esterase/lipase
MRTLYSILTMIFCCYTPFAFSAAQSTWHFRPSDVNALHSKPADYRISYGKDPLQFGDLRLPSGPGPYPVVIIIHGGCWLSKLADLQNTAALADAFRDMGIATWNVEYRREDDKGGGWPGTFEDVAHAADFLRTIAKQYSLDLNHVVAVGQSAGGYLVLWLAGRHRLLPSSQLYMENPLALKGVIVLGGVPDLKAFRPQGQPVCGADVIGKLLGDTPEQVEAHYKDASPIELLPLGVPQVLFYGADEQAVPKRFAEAYIKAARKKGDTVKLVEIEYAGHHEYNVPNSVTWPAIHSALLSFLDKNTESR